MKILFVMHQYALDTEKKICSCDYYNVYMGAKKIFGDVGLFDYYRLYTELGRDEMNRKLLETVRLQKPDIVFVIMHLDEVAENTIDKIRENAICLGFFHDDKWREEYVKHWAGHFSYILCTDPDGEKRFAAMGISNALSFPQPCNPDVYVSDLSQKNIDVSFVGTYSPYRAWLIDRVRKSGINVQVFGTGWHRKNLVPAIYDKVFLPSKKYGVYGQKSYDSMLPFTDMIEIFGRTKINLNLSNSTCWDARYLLSSPLALWNTVRSAKYRDGIKLRCFEIGASGGFQLTYYEEGLERYYKIGEEIAIFINPDDLIEKVKYYLFNENERELLAKRGYMRTLADHTVKNRFEYVLHKINR